MSELVRNTAELLPELLFSLNSTFCSENFIPFACFSMSQRSIAGINSFNPQNGPASGDGGYSSFLPEEV